MIAKELIALLIANPDAEIQIGYSDEGAWWNIEEVVNQNNKIKLFIKHN